MTHRIDAHMYATAEHFITQIAPLVILVQHYVFY